MPSACSFFGSTPTVPGDLVGAQSEFKWPEKGKLKTILEGLRQNAARPATQTSHNRHLPADNPDVSNITHVFVERGKKTPLGPVFDGPFQITDRIGTSCVQIRVGSYANGEPRHEIQHWHNLKAAHMKEGAEVAQKPALGRKPLNPAAPQFLPRNGQPAPDGPANDNKPTYSQEW